MLHQQCSDNQRNWEWALDKLEPVVAVQCRQFCCEFNKTDFHLQTSRWLFLMGEDHSRIIKKILLGSLIMTLALHTKLPLSCFRRKIYEVSTHQRAVSKAAPPTGSAIWWHLRCSTSIPHNHHTFLKASADISVHTAAAALLSPSAHIGQFVVTNQLSLNTRNRKNVEIWVQ